MVTTTATRQAKTPDRPRELFRHWVPSREGGQADSQAFRPPDFDFPPSFGRDGFELRPDGEFIQDDVGPADGIVQVRGRWTQQGPGRVAIRFDGARPDYAFTVVSADDALLRIRPESIPATNPPTDATSWQLAQRDGIRAFRAGDYVLIVAEGQLPSPGYEVDIAQSPLRIFPQQYNLLSRALPGIWPQVLTPYRHAEVARYPADQAVVTVHHADGQDRVDIAACGEDLAEFAQVMTAQADGSIVSGSVEASGMSSHLSFDE